MTLRKAANRAVRVLKNVTSQWENQPDFTVVDTNGKSSVKLDKRTKAGKVFEWVDKGTPPHAIPPKNGPMTFKWGGKGSYWPATTPGSLSAGKAQSLGQFMSTYKVINHPGIQPRNIITAVIEDQQNQLLSEMEKEVQIWWKEA